MKSETMWILGLVAVGAYFAFVANKPAQSMTIMGGKAAPTNDGLLTVSVDGNMTPQEITSTATAWNTAMQNDDTNGIANVINALRAASHPIAADSLQGVISKIQQINAQPVAAAAQGYR